jgi:hypothetical protein
MAQLYTINISVVAVCPTDGTSNTLNMPSMQTFMPWQEQLNPIDVNAMANFKCSTDGTFLGFVDGSIA